MGCLDVLTQFSNRYGADADLVLAGGGNTSAKENACMYIKGSGVSLAEITPGGFVKMDLHKLRRVFETSYPPQDAERERLVLADLMAARCAGEQEKRPSVETPLHALFPQTYVLHVHPALVNALTCSAEGEAAAQKTISRDFIWIPSCKPGYKLAQTCAKAMADFRARKGSEASLILLQNHGVFFAADTPQGLEELLAGVLTDIRSRLTIRPFEAPEEANEATQAAGQTLAGLLPGQAVYRYCGGTDIRALCASKAAAAPLLLPFTPDHIVYCRAYPLFLESLSDAPAQMEAYQNIHGYPPRVVLLRNTGAFCLGENEKQADTCCALFLDAVNIAVYAKSFGGCRHLTREMTEFIIYWEVESYRAKQL